MKEAPVVVTRQKIMVACTLLVAEDAARNEFEDIWFAEVSS